MLCAFLCGDRLRRTYDVVGRRCPHSSSTPCARSDTPIVLSQAASSWANAGPAHPLPARWTRPQACNRGGDSVKFVEGTVTALR